MRILFFTTKPFIHLKLSIIADVYFFAVLHKRGEKATKQNFQSYIEKFYPVPSYFNGLGLENQELPVVIDLLKEYGESETIFYFITSGDFHEPAPFMEEIIHSPQTCFWEMIILNEEEEIDTKYHSTNLKIVPFKTIRGLDKGELHQTILRPIHIWRNRDSI